MLGFRSIFSWAALYSKQIALVDIAAEFDRDFYLESYPDIAAAGVDPLQHYMKTGWKERRDPAASFSTGFYLDTYPDVASAGVNPFHHYIRIGRRERRSAVPGAAKAKQNTAPIPQAKNQAEFDRDFYLGRYPDVAASGIDPLQHYMTHGWKERRDPAAFFSTGYYLDTYPDVAKAGVNPFSHFIATGRAEGRRALHALGHKAEVLAQLKPMKDRVLSLPQPEAPYSLLDASAIRSAIEGKLAGFRKNLIIAIAHDDYANISGGTQLSIRAEEAAALQDGHFYLGVWPTLPLPCLSMEPDPLVDLRFNGIRLGTARCTALIAAMTACPIDAKRVHLVVHLLLGHDPGKIAELAQTLGLSKAWYWLHDYFGLCQSYTLRRNDLVYCGAPPQSSGACGICVYGQDRPAHLDRVRAVFDALAVTVVSPSEAALDVWKKGADFPVHSTVVHPHGDLVCVPNPKRSAKASAVPTNSIRTEPVRLAFLGATVAHKGWDEYLDLATELRGMAGREFHYLGHYDNVPSHVRKTDANVAGGDPDAMLRAVRAAGIDVFVNWSAWPETFSYTTLEAIAAGAVVLTNQISGNVAALVRMTGKGRVFASLDQLVSFVRGPGLDRLVLEARAARASEHVSINRSRQTLDLIAPKGAGR